jgi:IMP dehydrogenase
MLKSLSYDDVLLVPQFSDIKSRTEVSLDTDLTNGLRLNTPIISSPMDTVTEGAMATVMAVEGGTAIVHRYNDLTTQGKIVKSVVQQLGTDTKVNIGGAIGVSGDYIERATELINCGANFLCIDVAHGHHTLVKNALTNIRKLVPDTFHIMAGNVATLQGVNDLADWGANSVRCNIGGGSICSTRIQTGHGLPGLQTIIECSKTDRDVGIIADGGIRNAGDIVKALAAGADAVMCGSLLAGTAEAPGEVFRDETGTWKTYRGMASKEAQVNWRGSYSSFEGVSSKVPYRGHVDNILSDLKQNIRSGLSYSGARSIKELQLRAIFTEQTSAGTKESGTHINSRKW